MSSILGIPLKYPVIFNSHRSSVILPEEEKTTVLALHISQSKDYKTLDLAIKLLKSNLVNILSTLNRLKERQGLGKVDSGTTAVDAAQSSGGAGGSTSPENKLRFDNKILAILYEIAEF